jgi:hypothetical protein
LTIAGAGAIHGISVGSKFAIWKSLSDVTGDPLAIVTVDVVKGHESMASFNLMKGDSKTFVAKIKENPEPKLFIHIPENIEKMKCFRNLFSEGRPPLSIAVTKDRSLASIGLTYLDEYDEIGFEMLNPEEQGQKIRHTINAAAADLYEALDHLCHYYYHRDRVNPRLQTFGQDGVPISSQFTVDMFRLEEKDGFYMPCGPNLNIQGIGVQLTVGSHNEEDNYGFRIINNTDFSVFPCLFYFDSSNFSISTLPSLNQRILV